MKTKIDVEIPEGYEIFGSKRGNVCTDLDGLTRVYVEIILRKKTRKVIVFVPVDSFGEATVVECAGRYGTFEGKFGSWYDEPGDEIEWLRLEEREEEAR